MPLDLQLKNLYNLPEGFKSKILLFTEELMASKLMTMGVLQGLPVEMVRKAPFGGACFVKINDQRLALRRDEAESIIIE